MNKQTINALFISLILATCIVFSPSAHAQPASEAQISSDGTNRYIAANGMPNHSTESFPNAFANTKPAPQKYAFRVPLKPQKTVQAAPVPPSMFFGVALNGVPFEVAPKSFWEDKPQWGFEPLHTSVQAGTDANNGDVLENGAFVYRGIPKVLVREDFIHVGYAADGFPIFVSTDKKYKSSYKMKEGERERSPLTPSGFHNGQFSSDYEFVKDHGNLDACNGVTINKKYYIYILTEEFPYTPRCWSGKPDQSFEKSFAQQVSNASESEETKAPNMPTKQGEARRALPRR